jgi:hypothetical protein
MRDTAQPVGAQGGGGTRRWGPKNTGAQRDRSAPYSAGVLLDAGSAFGLSPGPLSLTIDWSTAATLATALGTLVLAVATFAAVRSANRAARVAEAAFQVNLRPVLVTSRIDDSMQKIRWSDDHWSRIDGGQGTVEVVDGSIYLAISLRNVGSGLAVSIGWVVREGAASADVPHRDPSEFRMQTRDLYTAPNDMGFWQAAIRDVDDPDYAWARRSIETATPFTVELLYGDSEGGQRTISRFGMIPLVVGEKETRWYPSVARHWNLDRPDPR